MENLNNVFIIYNEEESKKISFLEDNKERILNNYIENDNISDFEKISNFWKNYFIKDPDIKSKIIELLSNSGIKSNTNFQDIRGFDNSIDFYSIVLKSIEFDSYFTEDEEIFFFSKTNEYIISIPKCYYPILVFQDKIFYYLIELYDEEFNLFLVKKEENNENMFHRLLMDMSL